MTFKSKSESGLGHVVLLALAVLVVGVIGYVGMRVVNNQNDDSEAPTTTSVTPVAIPSKVESKQDLDTVKASLNKVNLDSDLNSGSFDGDVNSML